MVAILQSRRAPTRAEFHAAISNRSDRWFAACLKITRNREMAEDAVQNALLSAWQKRDQFDGSARLDTWIHRIAINAALQLLRKTKPGLFEPLETDIEDFSESPEKARADSELGQYLGSALTHLSDVERICFVLRHLEQWRLREIANEIDSNEGAVKQAVFRAVRKLRTRLCALQGDEQ